MKDHGNDNIKDLLTFIGRHDLYTLNEWKEVLHMLEKSFTQEEIEECMEIMRGSTITKKWMQEALEEGKEEGIEDTLRALAMIKEGLTEKEIAESTILWEDEVRELRKICDFS